MSKAPDDQLALLKAGLLRTRRQPMNFAVGLGKQPDEHQLRLHATRAGRALAKEVKDDTGLKLVTWGSTEPDASRPDTLVLAIEDKALGGLQKKLQNWLKLQGMPIRKVAVKLNGHEVADDDPDEADSNPAGATPTPAGPVGAPAVPPVPNLAAQEAALKQLALKVRACLDQERKLDALLVPAVKACQRALQQGEREAADAALKHLALRLQEAHAHLAKAQADFEAAASPLEPALNLAVNKVRQLQADPQVRKDRQQLAKTSTAISKAIQQARKAAKSGNAAEAKAVAEFIAKERTAARKVLAPYWPGGAGNPEGDWSLIVARLDVSSPKDAAVFWSGDKDNAIDLAIERGGISLESTGGGAMIDEWNETGLPWSGDDGAPPPHMMDLWQLASATYAIQAEGIITAIQTPEKQLTDGGEMWRRVERKILLKKELQGLVTLTDPVIKPANPKKA